jgi:hypothetical protein
MNLYPSIARKSRTIFSTFFQVLDPSRFSVAPQGLEHFYALFRGFPSWYPRCLQACAAPDRCPLRGLKNPNKFESLNPSSGR